LSLLDASTFIRLAETSESFLPLVNRSSLGLDTALQLKRHGEALRFGIQTKLISDVIPIPTTKAEVLARLHLGDYQAAIKLAQSSALKPHRLQLLASIGRFQKKQGLSAEVTILDALEHLADQVHTSELGDELFDIASDLMFSRPNLAVRLISRASETRPDDRRFDWALAKMSAVAATQSDRRDKDLTEAVADIRSKISDPQVRSLSGRLSMLFDGTPARDILKQVKAFESAGDQIFFLRQWCRYTKDPVSAWSIIDHAVFLSIRTTEYTPTARDYRDLAEPLPKINNTSERTALIEAFDLQKAVARKAGPIQDYVKLQILLAEAESQGFQVRAGQRVAELYEEVQAVSDIEVRCVCLAQIVASVRDIDPYNAFSGSAAVKELSELQFEGDIRTLLESTADHYAVTSSIIEALSEKRIDLAEHVVNQLNYQYRRDRAWSDLITHLVKFSRNRCDLEVVTKVLNRVVDSEIGDRAVRLVLKAISDEPEEGVKPLIGGRTLQLIDRSLGIKNPVIACQTICSAMALLAGADDTSSLSERLIADLLKRWRSIDDLETRIHVGYLIVSDLADHNRALAEQLMGEIALDPMPAEDSLRGTLLQCGGLAIRAYSGLLPMNLDSSQDMERLTGVINATGSRSARVRLWTDLAVRLVQSRRTDESRRIVQTKLRPLLEGLRVDNEFDWLEAIRYAAPALYIANPIDALGSLDALPLHWKEDAYGNLTRYKLTGVGGSEPYNRAPTPFEIDYDACTELMNIAERVEADYELFSISSYVAESATWKLNKHLFTQTQKNTIAEKIKSLARNKLPAPSGIRHDGYKVLVEAQALRLQKGVQPQWSSFVERGRSIPNLSDRVFVLAHLAECLPSQMGDERLGLFEEAFSLASSISSTRDRLERMQIIAALASDFDKGLTKKILRAVSEVIKSARDTEADEDEVRKLVDLAYQVDPELAVTLASQLDKDEARKAARERLQYQKLRQKLSASEYSAPPANCAGEDLADAVRDLLGQLNANRAAPREVGETMKLLRHTKNVTFEQAVPIFSFVIENAISRRGNSSEAKAYLRDVFDATLRASEIAQAVISRAAGRSSSVIDSNIQEGRTLIASGEREKALEAIAEWIRTSVHDELYVCDPYFGPDDLELLRLVQNNKGGVKITIVTSRKQQERHGVTFPYDDFYADYWKRNFSEQAPPQTEIVVVGGHNGELPIHDRWLISRTTGLRLGTSLNGLGRRKDAELTPLRGDEVEERMKETMQYVHRHKREHLGQRLNYAFFELQSD